MELSQSGAEPELDRASRPGLLSPPPLAGGQWTLQGPSRPSRSSTSGER